MSKRSKISLDKILIVIFVVCVCCIIYFALFPLKKENSVSNIGSECNIKYSDKIKKNQEFKQSIQSKYSNVTGFQMRFSTLKVKNTTGKIHITIKRNDETIYDESLPLSNLIDNEYYSFYFEPQYNTDNDVFTVQFYYDEYNEGNSLAYWYTKEDDNKLVIDNNKSSFTVQIFAITLVDDYFIIWYFLIIITICIGLLSVLGVGENEKER